MERSTQAAKLCFAICTALSLLLFAAFSSPATAQDLDTVTISGRIADPNGALVPGATVTARQVENNLERAATTDDEGRYRIIELQPGTYEIKATAFGFGVQERKGLTTISGQNL